MATLKDFAKEYEPKQTKNIADLTEVSTDLEIISKTGKDKDGKEFDYLVIVVDGEDYRIPGKVVGDLKAILKENPALKKFKVKKSGSGLATTYTVIPLG